MLYFVFILDHQPCADPDKAKCTDICMGVNGTDTCLCAYPYDSNCLDINECAQSNSPCGVHSKCVNKKPFFECKCDAGYLLDDDGLACSGKTHDILLLFTVACEVLLCFCFFY